MDKLNTLNALFDKAKNVATEATFDEVKTTFVQSKEITPLQVDLSTDKFFSVKNLFIMTSIIAVIVSAFVLLNFEKTTPEIEMNRQTDKPIEEHLTEGYLLKENTQDNLTEFSENSQETEPLTLEELELKALEINTFLNDINELRTSSYQKKKSNQVEISTPYRFPELTAEEIKENNKRKEHLFKQKRRNPFLGYVYIPSGSIDYLGSIVSHQSFCMKQTEVTNLEYKTFLFDLLIQNRKEEFLIAAPDQNKWVEIVGEDTKPMADTYFWHENFFDYPVVNVSLKGAQMYCDWLTEENMKLNPELHGKHYRFRIPQHSEWYTAASIQGEHKTYPWGGASIVNEEKHSRANYREVNNAESMYTVKVYSYETNDFGLFNMSGNVSEMVYYRENISEVVPKLATAGGNWMDNKEDLKLSNVKIHSDKIPQSPGIGFRVVYSYVNPRFATPYRTAHFNNRLPVLSESEIKQNEKEKSKLLKSIVSPDTDFLAAVPSGKVNRLDKSVQSFLIQRTEVTNEEYRIFLNDLLIQGKLKYADLAMPDFVRFNNLDKSFSYIEREMLNSTFERGDVFPINCILRKGAEKYCEWLNEEIKKAYPNVKINPVRIPQRIEIQRADEYWGVDEEQVKVSKSEGNFLVNDTLSNYGKLMNSSRFVAPAGFIYPGEIPENYRLRNLKGNLAEMCYDGKKPGTVGGSWADPKEQMDLFAPDNNAGVTEPRGNIGFRIVITVTDNKNHQKFIRKHKNQ